MSKLTQSMSWRTYRWLPALVLFCAATFKAFNAPQLLAGEGLLSSVWLLLPTIFAEGAASVLLVVLHERLAYKLSIVLFTGLACIATFSLLSGHDCHCFGNSVGASFTLPLDIVLIIGAIAYRPQPERIESETILLKEWPRPIAAGAALILVSSWQILNSERSDPVQFLLADELVSNPWPLGGQYHQALESLETGKWLVIIGRRDCSHCHEILTTFFSNPKRHRAGERTAVLIAGSRDWPFTFDLVGLEFTPTGSIRWESGEPFVASPAVFLLEDGIVMLAAEGDDSEHLLVELLEG